MGKYLFAIYLVIVPNVTFSFAGQFIGLEKVSVVTEPEGVDWDPGGTNRMIYWRNNNNGTRYRIFHEGDEWAAWISSSTYYSGSKGMGLGVYAHTGTCADGKDRSEFFFTQNSTGDYLKFGRTRWVGFYFYISESSSKPTDWSIFFQVWQYHDPGNNPLYPPLALEWKNDTGETWTWELYRCVDGPGNGTRSYIGGGTHLQPGEWYKIQIGMTPSHTEDETTGSVSIWIDDVEVINASVDFGFEPDPQEKIEDKMDTRTGVYRACQNTDQEYFYDNLHWGVSKRDSNPDSIPTYDPDLVWAILKQGILYPHRL